MASSETKTSGMLTHDAKQTEKAQEIVEHLIRVTS